MRQIAAFLLMLACCTVPLAAQSAPLAVSIALSKTSALFGEPIWIEVTATNRTSHSLAVDWGADCPDFFSKTISIEVPAATPGNGQPKPCGIAGSCARGFDPPLDPGESQTRRYVLTGDFRITHPGRYQVIVHKPFSYAPAPEKETIGLPKDHSTQTFDFKGSLDLLPPDTARLLAIEQALSAEALTPSPNPPLQVPAGLDHDAYMQAVRAWSDANRKRNQGLSRDHYEIFQGLAAYPAAGMEPVFVDWQTPPHSVGYGIEALKNLNTPAARKALAQLAQPVPDRIINGIKQSNSRWTALRALGGLGDPTYLALIESYANDPDQEVRRSAIFGAGELGGANALPFLDKIARQTTSQVERNDAIITMGRTASAQAVPLLIALFDVPSPGDPGAPNYPLSLLTHHSLPPELQRATPSQMQTAWRQWWDVNHVTAQIFGQYDCTSKFDR
jgi:hypothetical protein